jgi:DNA mismatch repair protein MutH
MAAVIRPTLSTVMERILPLLGVEHMVPRTENKGNAGHYLETLLGIPHSSACLDCEDGELKVFPLKYNAAKQLVPKETVAVTMCNQEALCSVAFEDSKAAKKLRNTLFIPYLRTDKDTIIYYTPFCFTADHVLWQTLADDYAAIQQKAKEGIMTSSIGTYLQTRTKGAGHGSTSRAFYLRTQFLATLFPNGYTIN